jgi:hypothetical protein
MDENDLQINITAVDDASQQIDNVAETVSEMADTFDSAATSINTALASVSSGLTAAEEAMADAAAASIESWGGVGAEIGESVEAAVPTVQGALESLMESNAEAAQQVLEQWQQEGAAMEESLAATLAEADEETAAAGETMNTNLAAGMAGLGIALRLVGQPLQNFYQTAVSGAAAAEQAQVSLSSVVQDAITQGGQVANVDSDIGQQKQYVIDQINAQRAALAAAEVPISGYGKTTQALGAAQEEAAAKIKTITDQINVLSGSLDRFNDLQSMAGQNAGTVTEQFEALARQNTNLGFTYEDSVNSLALALTGTGDYSAALKENAVAMDIVALKGGTVEAATDALNKAMSGNTFALQQYGINVKEGVSGLQILQDTMDQVSGTAQAQAATWAGQIAIVQSKWDLLMQDLGTTQGGVLGPFLHMVESVIGKLDDWANEHPKIAQAVLLFVGVLGTLMVVVGSLLVLFGLVAVGIGAVAAGWVALGIVITAFVVTALAVVVENWNAILDFIKKNWAAILAVLLPGIGSLVEFMHDHWSTIKGDVEDAWNWIYNFISGIWSKVVADAESAVSTIENLINKIMSPITTLTSAAANIAGGIGNLAGTAIKAFAAGGIVTQPTLALVGEAGPEAVIPLSSFEGGSSLGGGGGSGGGNGGMQIILQGNFYGTDQRAAQQFSQYIARSLNTNIKLRRI